MRRTPSCEATTKQAPRNRRATASQAHLGTYHGVAPDEAPTPPAVRSPARTPQPVSPPTRPTSKSPVRSEARGHEKPRPGSAGRRADGGGAAASALGVRALLGGEIEPLERAAGNHLLTPAELEQLRGGHGAKPRGGSPRGGSPRGASPRLLSSGGGDEARAAATGWGGGEGEEEASLEQAARDLEERARGGDAGGGGTPPSVSAVSIDRSSAGAYSVTLDWQGTPPEAASGVDGAPVEAVGTVGVDLAAAPPRSKFGKKGQASATASAGGGTKKSKSVANPFA